MAIKPKDHKRFFDKLGSEKVEAMLVNRELSGEDEKQARDWLGHYKQTRNRRTSWLSTLTGALMTGAFTVAGVILAQVLKGHGR